MRVRHLALPLVAAALLLAGCASAQTPAASAPASSAPAAATPSDTATAAPLADGQCAYEEAPGGVRDVEVPPADPVTGAIPVTLTTSIGTIGLTLDADRTPCTVNSFVSLAEQGYFTDTSCHRLTTAGIFVLQCGDPSATGRGGPGYRFDDELDGSETYAAGTLAMANAGPGTNGSQFFIVYEDSLGLPPNYTVFGSVDPASLALVQAAAAAGVDGGGQDGAPKTPVEISAVSIDG